MNVSFPIALAWAAIVGGAGCSSPRLAADFEGAHVGRVEHPSKYHFVCQLPGQADHEGRNRQISWYYFRIDGARGHDVTVTLTDIVGEYDYKPGAVAIEEGTPPLLSVDGRTWRHLADRIAVDKKAGRAVLQFRADADRVFVAHVEPYTVSRLDAFLATVRAHPHYREEVLGKTVQSRDLRLLTITDPTAPEADKRVVWLMIRQHAWETGTSFAGEGAIQFLLSDAAADVRRRAIFKIFPMMDPDGCAAGGIRFNRNGYDVNRNWDTADPDNAEHRRLMPEITAAKKAMRDWIKAGRRFDLFLTIHNTQTGEYLTGSHSHPEVADRFFAQLTQETMFDPSQTLERSNAKNTAKNPPAPGRATVADYLDREHKVPAFLMELRVARVGKLGRLPTSEDRRAFGRDLAKVMARVASM